VINGTLCTLPQWYTAFYYKHRVLVYVSHPTEVFENLLKHLQNNTFMVSTSFQEKSSSNPKQKPKLLLKNAQTVILERRLRP
jgi:hypothetical protein